MERLPGGRRLRLASSLGLGQRCWEVTLDEERGLLAWRDPRPPRRGAGEWSCGSGTLLGRGGEGAARSTCRAGPPASGPARTRRGRQSSGFGAARNGVTLSAARSRGFLPARGALSRRFVEPSDSCTCRGLSPVRDQPV